MTDMSWTDCGHHCTVYVNWTIMLYTFDLHRDGCQSVLNKTGGKKTNRSKRKKEKLDEQPRHKRNRSHLNRQSSSRLLGILSNLLKVRQLIRGRAGILIQVCVFLYQQAVSIPLCYPMASMVGTHPTNQVYLLFPQPLCQRREREYGISHVVMHQPRLWGLLFKEFLVNSLVGSSLKVHSNSRI